MARPTNKVRLKRALWLVEWEKRLKFCEKFNMKTLNRLAVKLKVTDAYRYSEKYRYKYAKGIANKTRTIQDIWSILIND